MLKTFILHYTPLTERRKWIQQQIEKHNITNYEFVTEYDKEDLNTTILRNFNPKLQMSEISLFMKHIRCYQRIIEDTTNQFFLVLEDDVILCDDFMSIVSKYIAQLPADFDMCFLGNGCNLHVNTALIKPDVNVYNVQQYSKCTDSFVISKRYANCMIESFALARHIPINLPIDHWFNSIGNKNQCNSYWVEPTIVTQGTQVGLFKSSIR